MDNSHVVPDPQVVEPDFKVRLAEIRDEAERLRGDAGLLTFYTGGLVSALKDLAKDEAAHNIDALDDARDAVDRFYQAASEAESEADDVVMNLDTAEDEISE